MYFLPISQKLGVILIHLHWTATVTLAVVIFFDSLRKKRSLSPTKKSGIACSKNSCGTLVENHWSRGLASQTNPEAKNAELILLKNVLFTLSTRSFSFFFGTLWVLPGYVSGMQTIRPLSKSLPFIFSQSILTHLQSADTF